MRRLTCGLGVLLVSLLAAACGARSGKASGTAAQTPSEAAAISTVDCTATNPACPELAIQGDAPATFNGAPATARGFADPSMRKDPATGALWMAYSWPHSQVVAGAGGGVVAVDNHLARSTDNGASWTYVGPMWTSSAETGDAGEAGWRNHEVVSLAPAQTSSGTLWFSAHESYFTRVKDGPKVTSFTIRVAMADSPDKLAQAPQAVLGFDLTSPYWHPDLNLDSLSKDLSGCVFRDPGIFFVNGTLYMAAECSLYTPSGENAAAEFVGLFATVPSGQPTTWQWRYAGKLGTHADAVELGGDMLNQTEITTARDGSTVVIFSPAKPSTPLETHLGCRVIQVASLDPPRLARDGSGKLKVLASATASDQEPYGPAACTYEPASVTGLILVRRLVRPQLIVSLNATGLRP